MEEIFMIIQLKVILKNIENEKKVMIGKGEDYTTGS